MHQEGKQLEAVSYRSDASTLLLWLAEWNHFAHECRECQQELALPWQICTHCDIRLATHCPECQSPLPPVGANRCPCCSLVLILVKEE